MRQFGSDRSVGTQNQSAVTDPNGNLIVSPDTDAGATPLGIAARTQVAIGLPNGTFNLLPADPMQPINAGNELPYWTVLIDGTITAQMYWDVDTQTWSLGLDPSGSAIGDTCVVKTQIPIVNDEGLDIRHYVSSSQLGMVKSAGVDRWSLVLTAQYYDTTGAAIGTPYTIGTFLERQTTPTNISNYTNASGSIDTTAAVLELVYTLTVSGTGSNISALLRSVTVVTEYGAIGGGGGIPETIIDAKGDLIVGSAADTAARLAVGVNDAVLTADSTATNGVAWKVPATPTAVPDLVIETFTSSTTWTVPAGVKKLEALIVGGAGGGGGGGGVYANTTSGSRSGGGGGGGGSVVYMQNIWLAGASSVVVTIGSGGTGGAGASFSKASGSGTTTNTAGSSGTTGGNTSFGSIVTINGSSAGTGTGGAGQTQTSSQNMWHGHATGTISGTNYWFAQQAVSPGGNGGTSISGSTSVNAGTSNLFSNAALAFDASASVLIGATGATATGTGGTWSLGGGGASQSGNTWGGGGGGGGAITTGSTRSAATGGSTGGGGGGFASQSVAVSGTYTGGGGNGGHGSGDSIGGGGGGGGGCAYLVVSTGYSTSTVTLTGGTGGNGGDGYIVIAYYG